MFAQAHYREALVSAFCLAALLRAQCTAKTCFGDEAGICALADNLSRQLAQLRSIRVVYEKRCPEHSNWHQEFMWLMKGPREYKEERLVVDGTVTKHTKIDRKSVV